MSDLPEVPKASQPADTPDTLSTLRRYTEARIALGRVGSSLPTAEVLDFAMAHARARDAVHLPFDTQALASALTAAGFTTLSAHSEATDRAQYLRRPDLGRRLHPGCVSTLQATPPIPANRLTIILADGLSSLAPMRHALPLLLALRDGLPEAVCGNLSNWTLDPIILATQARVALSDPIGVLRQSEAVVMLIGERPGLGAPDSLGIYLTYHPRAGRTNAERNCISNVRAAGLAYAEAAHRLLYLLHQSRTLGQSGLALKDAASAIALSLNSPL